MSAREFFMGVLQMARDIHAKTQGRMLVETLLCQFADETGFHAEGCWQGNPNARGRFNYAGISPGGHIADFASQEDFANSYVLCITQGAYGYPEVLEATNPVLQMTRLGRSSWAGSRYDSNHTGKPGIDLVNLWTTYEELINQVMQETGTPEPVLVEPKLPYLSAGARGQYVAQLQSKLPGLVIDGVFGPQTLQAVKTFQLNHGLIPDGVVGPKTWAALDAVK